MLPSIGQLALVCGKLTAKLLTPALLRTMAAAVLLLAMPEAALPAPLPPMDGVVTYTVVDQELRDVLVEVTRQSGLRVNISDGVRGRVRGRLPSAPFPEFLDRLATMYGLDWYFDGSTVFISAAGEAVSKMLPLGSVDPAQLTQTLAALGISDQRWPLRAAADAKVMIVDGPPRYLQLVEQTVGALSRRSEAVAKVNVFRGSVSK